MHLFDVVPEGCPMFGLRNRITGRVVRVEPVDGGIYGPKAGLTYDPGRPYWRTEDVQSLIETVFEDRPRYNAHPDTPVWNGVDVRECDPVRFFEFVENGPGGGDHVAVTRYMKTFEFEIVDLREPRFQTADVATVHYGPMQTIFRLYDMDRMNTMALALVGVPAGTPESLGVLGDVGLTTTRGPCMILEVVPAPDDWILNALQQVEREEGLEHRLVLLDMAHLADRFDYNQIDCHPTLRSAEEAARATTAAEDAP